MKDDSKPGMSRVCDVAALLYLASRDGIGEISACFFLAVLIISNKSSRSIQSFVSNSSPLTYDVQSGFAVTSSLSKTSPSFYKSQHARTTSGLLLANSSTIGALN